jgi:hypothetical protein
MDLTGLKVYPLVTLRNVTSRDKSSEAVIHLMSTVIIGLLGVCAPFKELQKAPIRGRGLFVFLPPTRLQSLVSGLAVSLQCRADAAVGALAVGPARLPRPPGR